MSVNDIKDNAYQTIGPESSLSVAQRLFHVTFKTSGVLYWIGGWLFLFGSILFYPRYANIYDIPGEGALIGGWLFVFGCIMFQSGSLIEVWNARYAHKEGSDFNRFLPMMMAVSNVLGSVCFVYGGVYFLPKYYNENPSLGCYLFIAGCSIFSYAILIDVPRMIREKQAIFGLWTTCAVFNMVGNILFIVGSYYFLPKFLFVEDADLASSNLIYSTNYFVVGSVAFIIAPTAQVIALYKDVASAPVAAALQTQP
ncbi:hypothetical protein AC1031_014337 [Aphanomyces cochlioides]|nr:hypothetical protein AC1031_014337 [Aphanomyces cochlioides]